MEPKEESANVSKQKSPEQKGKGLMKKPHTVPALPKAANPDNFISYALQSGRSIDEIQQLIKFRNDELARLAELEFKAAKAEFIKTCPAIVKNRDVPLTKTQSGKTFGGYRYTDLDNLINTIKEAEGNAGLSHEWQDGRNERGEIVVTCILSHVGGHEKRTTMAWPMDPSGGKNDIQAMKSTVSYLRRATLESVLGVSQGGDDDDGSGAPGQEAKGLDTPNEEGFRILLKSVRMGTMTMEQVEKTYSLTPEQKEIMQGFSTTSGDNPLNF